MRQTRAWIAAELREALGRPTARQIEQRLERNALARFYHWKKLNLLAPLRATGTG